MAVVAPLVLAGLVDLRRCGDRGDAIVGGDEIVSRGQVVDEATIEIELYDIDDGDVTCVTAAPAGASDGGTRSADEGWRWRRLRRAIAPPLQRTGMVSTVRRVVDGEFGDVAQGLVGALADTAGERPCDGDAGVVSACVEVATGRLVVTGGPRHETQRSEVRLPGVLHVRSGVFGVRVALVAGPWSATRSELRLEVCRRWCGRHLTRRYFDTAHDVLDRLRDEFGATGWSAEPCEPLVRASGPQIA